MNYDADAVKANVISVKMYGWRCAIGHFRSAEGCDIKYGDVAYCSYNLADATGQASVRSAMNSVSNYCMVSGSGTGGKLFVADYLAGSYDNANRVSGTIMQNGSNYLAVELGMDWNDILSCYYDNSSFNNPNVGIVQIRCISHSYASVYQHSSSGHWRVCIQCGANLSVTAHTWITAGSYQRCVNCHRQVRIGGEIVRLVSEGNLY